MEAIGPNVADAFVGWRRAARTRLMACPPGGG